MRGIFHRRGASLLFIGLVLAAFLLFARVGKQSAARGDRVLSSADPAAEFVKKSGGFLLAWLWRNAVTVGTVVTLVALALGIVAIAVGRRRAVPLAILLAGASLATWGQIFLWQRGATSGGVFLYLGGIVCAAVVGWLHPMTRLTGFPALPSPAEPDSPSRVARPGLPPGEWAVVLGLTLLGLLLRGWALNQHPASFDGETTPMMLGSYTGFGIRYYLTTEFLGTGNGVFHVFAQYVFYRLFGASIFTIRLVALFWGVVAIPLLYWLARRIAGRGAAIVATVLFIAAPEQLFWSRADNNFFTTVAVVTLVTAHLGLSMQERFAPRAVLAAAIWMPFCRFSYTPSFVLFTLPLLLAAHAAVFVRGVFRRLLYAAPILLGGFLLWVFSLSVVESSLQPRGGWRFINPATVRGEAAWRQNISKDAGPLEVLRTQIVRVTRNAGIVLAGMTYRARYTTHWYDRYVVGPGRNTMISAGLAVLCALGVGYLLGQPRERRAALLLLWIAIGLLPGCMSDEPEARRISIVFPALSIVAGVFVAAAARLARESAARWVARGTTAALAAVVVLTAFAGLASNLLLATEPLGLDAEMRFARPLFERNDMVLHNLRGLGHEIPEIGALDPLVGGRPGRCSQLVEDKDWPGAVLAPRCDFTDLVFQLTLSPEERELRRKSYRPTRVGYLLRETRESRARIELLRRLFPAAETKEFQEPKSEERFFTMEVPLTTIEALRAPEVSAGNTDAAARARSGLLEGVQMTVASLTTPDLTIRGGLFLPDQDWYRFRLEPACSSATLTAGTPLSDSAEARPLLAGVHPFAIRFRNAADCRLPLALRIEGSRKPVPTVFLAPRVVSAAPAVPVVAIPGYGDAKVLAQLRDRPVDLGVDGKGNIFVLTFGPEGWKVHRLAPDGKEEAVFDTELSRRENHATLSVDAEGNCLLGSINSLELRDRTGKRLTPWTAPREGVISDAGLLPDGRIVVCYPGRNSVEIFSRDGSFEGPLAPPGAGLVAPSGVAIAADGTIVVVEDTGLAHVFRVPAGGRAAVELATFRVAYPESPFVPDLAGCAFDGTKTVLFPHRSLVTPLLYDLQGRPLMASVPERDLSAKGLKESHAFCATREALYILDSYPSAVIRVARP